jgi:hypothetical protein
MYLVSTYISNLAISNIQQVGKLCALHQRGPQRSVHHAEDCYLHQESKNSWPSCLPIFSVLCMCRRSLTFRKGAVEFVEWDVGNAGK